MTHTTISPIALLLALALVLTTAACGSDLTAACEHSCECAPDRCNGDEDIDVCVAEGEAQADIASVYDCGEQFDALVECITEERSCEVESACAPVADTLDACMDGVDFARWHLMSAAP